MTALILEVTPKKMRSSLINKTAVLTPIVSCQVKNVAVYQIKLKLYRLLIIGILLALMTNISYNKNKRG